MKNLLFDLDGTLTDPAIGITGGVAYALEKYGIVVEDHSTLHPFIGPPLIGAFREFYGFSEERAVEALQYYREYFSTRGIFENECYEGIPEMLQGLKEQGDRIILCTSKPEEFANRILAHFDLAKYFDFVGGNTLSEARPAKEDVIGYILGSFPDMKKEDTVMIGDRKYDITAAKRFDLASVGVLYGYGSREELESAGADELAENVAELRMLLEKNG